MDIQKILRKEHICFLTNDKKEDAINELLKLLHQHNSIGDIEMLQKMFLAREELMSTGIGLGIGVPHVRIEDSISPLLAIGISKSGIKDYISMDDHPIKIIFMIIVSKGQHTQYIRLLSQIVTLLKDDQIRESLLENETCEIIFSRLTQSFSTINNK